MAFEWRSISATREELEALRGLNEVNLIRVLSETHDFGWASGKRELHRIMQIEVERAKLKQEAS